MGEERSDRHGVERGEEPSIAGQISTQEGLFIHARRDQHDPTGTQAILGEGSETDEDDLDHQPREKRAQQKPQSR